MAMTVNNIVCLKVAKRDLESSYHTYKNRQLCEVIAVFLNLIAAIISRYMHVSNHHVVCLKLCINGRCQLYLNEAGKPPTEYYIKV